jgi:amino acid adenylation domain-containing protein
MADSDGLAGRFLRGLELGPSREALRAGGVSYTYSWVHQTALRLAGAIGGSPTAGPARVGVLAGGAAAAHVGILATIYVGAAAVPLNPDFPSRRTVAMIRAAGLETVIADDRGAAMLASLRSILPDVRCVPADPGAGAGPPLAAPRSARDAAIAYIMFTSGSTGRPKGVPVSHGNVAHFLDCAQRRHQVSPADVLAQTFEPTFDLFMFGLFMAWSAGASLVATPPAILRRLPEFLAGQGVTLWFSVPSTIRTVRRLGRLTPGSLPSLTRSLFCGEALTWDDALAWQAAAPAAVLENLYGPTELTIACAAYRLPPAGQAPAAVGGGPVNGLVPIGHLHHGLRGLLVDAVLAPSDDQGELCVTGPQMFAGYLDPADDDGRFLSHGGQRWYRTGDRVRRIPGVGLAYLGRLDYQVKVRGYRVDLLEVEHALRRLGGVRDCAVVAVARDGETGLAAAYCGDPVPAAELARQLSASLPEYMVPRIIWHTAELPLNSNGKIDRPALAARAADAAVPVRGRD